MKRLIPILLGFAVVALLIAKLYDIGVNRPSLVFKDIPPETMDWVNSIRNGDFGISAAPTGPFNWNNKEDFGSHAEKVLPKWVKEEDGNFIVYHYRDKDAEWQRNARNVMSVATEAAAEIEKLTGHYVYPERMNGRKLSIYLADSANHYSVIVNKLSSGTATIGDREESEAISFMEVGPLGCRIKGIVMHPDCFRRGSVKYKTMLRREMMKVNFFASLDYNKKINHPSWFSEGLAEYFAAGMPQFGQVSPYMQNYIESQCDLWGDFRGSEEDVTAAGDCFFRFYEDRYGYGKLQELVRSAFEVPYEELFEAVGQDREMVKKEWVEALGGVMQEEE